MNIIEFNNPVLYNAATADIPLEWMDVSFATIDFTGKENLKDFLVDYFRQFHCSKSINLDSLIFSPNDLAYGILVAIYKEIAARITVDNYKFFVWPEYAATVRGLGFKSDDRIQEDIFGLKFVFIFDLIFHQKESVSYFCSIMNYCYANKVKMFIATRDSAIMEKLHEEFLNLSKSKLYSVKVK